MSRFPASSIIRTNSFRQSESLLLLAARHGMPASSANTFSKNFAAFRWRWNTPRNSGIVIRSFILKILSLPYRNRVKRPTRLLLSSWPVMPEHLCMASVTWWALPSRVIRTPDRTPIAVMRSGWLLPKRLRLKLRCLP